MANLSRDTLPLILWSFWTVLRSLSGPAQHPSPSPSFEADLLRINGDHYVIKDIAGVERQVHVGRDTEIFGYVKAGDSHSVMGAIRSLSSNPHHRQE